MIFADDQPLIPRFDGVPLPLVFDCDGRNSKWLEQKAKQDEKPGWNRRRAEPIR